MKFTKLYLLPSVVLFTLCSSKLIAQDKPLTASIAAISATAGYDRDDEDTKSLFYHNPQPELKYTFLVKANNIVQIMENTLVVEGDKTWECGIFNTTSENSKATSFSIHKKGSFMNLSELKFKGAIDIQIGEELIKKRLQLRCF